MTFIPFENLDDFFEQMARDEAAANDRATADQKAIGTPLGLRHYLRVDHGLVIIGEVHTLVETIDQERSYYDLDNPDEADEFHSTVDSLTDSYNRGYRMTRSMSEACPEGELGQVHVSVMAPLVPEEYDRLRRWILEK